MDVMYVCVHFYRVILAFLQGYGFLSLRFLFQTVFGVQRMQWVLGDFS
jgi:hypothetical protein